MTAFDKSGPLDQPGGGVTSFLFRGGQGRPTEINQENSNYL